MTLLELVTERLLRRYGHQHDYSILTKTQKKLLLSPDILENRDPIKQYTVSVSAIIRNEKDLPVLLLSDVYRYEFRRHTRLRRTYANERLASYVEICGPERCIVEDNVYQFAMADGEIRVAFNTEKADTGHGKLMTICSRGIRG